MIFENIPKVPININGKVINYADYFRFVDVNELFLPSFNNYAVYQISDGERPDQVSQKLYDNDEYYWTFFIINDGLKNGMKEWPLSTSALDQHLLDAYGNYGVCEISSTILDFGTDLLSNGISIDLLLGDGEIDLMDPVLSKSGYINGLDLTYPYLRVYRVDSNQSNELAEIEKYDDSRWQLWVKNVGDKDFFDPSLPSMHIGFKLINPYTSGTADYDTVEAENLAWLKAMKISWYDYHFIGVDLTDGEIQAELESKMIFNISTFYTSAENAPDYYYNIVSGKRLSNLIAQKNNEISIPVTFRETEEAKNDAKREIKVLRPKTIYRFEDRYNEVLNATDRLEVG
jgi:hypothetical protein